MGHGGENESGQAGANLAGAVLAVSTSRALVPWQAGVSPRPAQPVRADAAFLTQLLACQSREPAYRTVRRAAPAFALASYAATAGSVPFRA